MSAVSAVVAQTPPHSTSGGFHPPRDPGSVSSSSATAVLRPQNSRRAPSQDVCDVSGRLPYTVAGRAQVFAPREEDGSSTHTKNTVSLRPAAFPTSLSPQDFHRRPYPAVSMPSNRWCEPSSKFAPPTPKPPSAVPAHPPLIPTFFYPPFNVFEP
ncbi:hypothetical protein EIP91_008355 [Steccherinum ochraceum]|uniref:Uncharacterized protein n=1 Tax=Steccherinum ochraceum TaxID=92696 RepID=A0A4R0RQ03_9APHY|nr:hypothetical protein EIP91_008355 [Steccherinum ochraceum]